MRILHLITRLVLGGAQENTVLTCEGLAARGHKVTLAYGPIYGPEGSLQTRAEEKPVPWAEKDMTIVLKEADQARVSLPLCGVIKEVIKGIKIARGEGQPGRAG